MKQLKSITAALFLLGATSVCFANNESNEAEKKSHQSSQKTNLAEMKMEIKMALKQTEMKLMEEYLKSIPASEFKIEQTVKVYDVAGKLLFEGEELEGSDRLNCCDFLFKSGETYYYLKSE